MNYKGLLCDMERQARYYGISREELAAAGCMTERSLYNKLRRPESITLGELQQFAKKLRIEINYTIR